MKKSFYYLTIVFVFLLSSCLKDRNQIRVKNNFANDLKVMVGPTDYGTVKSISTTDYKKVPDGKQEITGDISGSITLAKRSKHKYTININSAGIVTLVDDGK